MPDEIDDWLAELAAALGVDDVPLPRDEILDLARIAAHGVARPAAPLTTFVVGLAAGRAGGDAAAALAAARHRLDRKDTSEPGQ